MCTDFAVVWKVNGLCGGAVVMSLFANFSCLDELIQVVYQDVNRFVVLSNVSSGEWAIHLGLTGEGRWWHGRWREADVTNLVGSNPSDFLLETFAEKLADSILKGDLYITNFDAGKDINITLAPTSKKPMNVALEVMDSKESAIYTCRVLLDAQKRKCHLHPDFISVQPPDPSSSATSSNPKPVSSPASRTEEIIEPKTKAGSSNDKKRKELELVKPESSKLQGSTFFR
ncbi:uncharacterized protein BT62DRAFT_593577 [Guyanagaster necrorhizus]|uniref:Uncharacterized protein n=1 Tax=Guyanagaster necrorhizus TaxID=856835 RepID=A0A9P7VZ26_9AGAR|nr:uncharacterized protein BT62DRAFT_593577 [Guyanagaster necrorhizus MCA 3950]KAG7449582.1 hypothetical protein BT62DRAFT_593577 [Guyanagaster necrorhizus MCA 3950]